MRTRIASLLIIVLAGLPAAAQQSTAGSSNASASPYTPPRLAIEDLSRFRSLRSSQDIAAAADAGVNASIGNRTQMPLPQPGYYTSHQTSFQQPDEPKVPAILAGKNPPRHDPPDSAPAAQSMPQSFSMIQSPAPSNSTSHSAFPISSTNAANATPQRNPFAAQPSASDQPVRDTQGDGSVVETVAQQEPDRKPDGTAADWSTLKPVPQTPTQNPMGLRPAAPIESSVDHEQILPAGAQQDVPSRIPTDNLKPLPTPQKETEVAAAPNVAPVIRRRVRTSKSAHPVPNRFRLGRTRPMKSPSPTTETMQLTS